MNKQAYLKMMNRSMFKTASAEQAQLLYKIAMMHKQLGITQWWNKTNNGVRKLWDVIWNWLRYKWNSKYKYQYQEAKDAFGRDLKDYGGLSLAQRALIRRTHAENPSLIPTTDKTKSEKTPAAATSAAPEKTEKKTPPAAPALSQAALDAAGRAAQDEINDRLSRDTLREAKNQAKDTPAAPEKTEKKTPPAASAAKASNVIPGLIKMPDTNKNIVLRINNKALDYLINPRKTPAVTPAGLTDAEKAELAKVTEMMVNKNHRLGKEAVKAATGRRRELLAKKFSNR